MTKRKKWTLEDDKKLISLINQGVSQAEVSKILKSSYGSISSRVSLFKSAGYIKDNIGTSHSKFNAETIREMKDACKRFGKISDIPLEWTEGWAQENETNLLAVLNKLQGYYKDDREK